jgi:MoxR-like ATPase
MNIIASEITVFDKLGIKKDAKNVYVCGIPLELGKGGAFTPDLNQFRADTITKIDQEFFVDSAICWNIQSIPCFEGGSGIGKSRAIQRIAAVLNQELYKIQGNQEITPEEIFGRMGVKPGAPHGLGFVEKSATLAIETGGILWFDEPNALPSESHIRLRELMDAIISGKRYFELSEDVGKRRIAIHPLTRVVLTQNEADGKNQALSPIRRADFGRLSYIRYPDELPQDVRKDRMLGRLGHAAEFDPSKLPEYQFHQNFSLKELGELFEGSNNRKIFYREYLNFINSLKRLYAEGRLGRDQKQTIYFDPERNAQTFLRYVAAFHTEDLEASCREGLRQIFKKYFKTLDDRAQVEELILKFTLQLGDDDDRVKSESDLNPELTSAGLSLNVNSFIKSPEQVDFEKVFNKLPVGKKMVVGRHPSSDLVFTSTMISRTHCSLIKQAGGSVLLQDLGSGNGTFLDDVLIESATISPGQKFKVAHIKLEIPVSEIPKVAKPEKKITSPLYRPPEDCGFGTASVLSSDQFNDLKVQRYEERNSAYFERGAHGASDSCSSVEIKQLKDFNIPGITVSEDKVSFMGAELSAVNSLSERQVPLQFFADDVLTEYDIRLMQTIAAAFAIGQIPVLEGGPGIGKSRTVDRIGAFLGQEVYYQLGRNCSVKALFGKITTDSTSPSGFKYEYGKATLAAMNGGILFVDEYNALPPTVRVYMRDLFDAYLSRSQDFTFLMAGKPEKITLHKDFRIVFSQNEAQPGDDLLSELQDADFNRLIYIRLPDELPEPVFQSRFLGRLGDQPKIELKKYELYNSALSIERDDLPKIIESRDLAQELWNVYDLFYYKIKSDIGLNLAVNRAQRIYLNYERAQEKVLAFFKKFYTGDPLVSFRQACYYVFCNMFETDLEKNEVRKHLEDAFKENKIAIEGLRKLRPAANVSGAHNLAEVNQ